MADDAQWIDEAAQQQIAPPDMPSPDAQVAPNDPGLMQRFHQFISQKLFPPRQPAANIEDVHPYFRPRQRELQQQLQHPLPQPDPRARPARRGVDQPAYSEDQWKDYFYQQLVDDMRRKGQRGPTQGGPR